MESKYISAGKAAKLIGVHKQTLEKYEEAGKLHSWRTIGNHRRYDVAELLATFGPRAQAGAASQDS